VPPVTGHLRDSVLSIARSGGDLVVSYLPASRFWTVQFIGGGLYLLIAATALGTAIWLLHRRTT
jgi:hypothetical protein